MAPEQQLNVARSVVMVRTRRGEVVVQEGSLGSFFYVVLAGAFAVWQKAAAGASPYGRDHPRWGGMVNELLTSHMFGENGLVRHCRRNASVTQESPGDGRLFQLSGMDFQAIMSREDPLSVRAKVSELRQWPALRELQAAAVRDTLLPYFRLTWVDAFEVLYSKGAAISATPSDVKLHLVVQGTVVKGVPAGQLPAGAAGGGMDEISRMIVTRLVRVRQQDSAVLLGTEALVCRSYPATVIAKDSCKCYTITLENFQKLPPQVVQAARLMALAEGAPPPSPPSRAMDRTEREIMAASSQQQQQLAVAMQRAHAQLIQWEAGVLGGRDLRSLAATTLHAVPAAAMDNVLAAAPADAPGPAAAALRLLCEDASAAGLQTAAPPSGVMYSMALSAVVTRPRPRDCMTAEAAAAADWSLSSCGGDNAVGGLCARAPSASNSGVPAPVDTYTRARAACSGYPVGSELGKAADARFPSTTGEAETEDQATNGGIREPGGNPEKCDVADILQVADVVEEAAVYGGPDLLPAWRNTTVLRAAPPNAVFGRTMDAEDSAKELDVFLGSPAALRAAAEATARSAMAAVASAAGQQAPLGISGVVACGMHAASQVIGIAEGGPGLQEAWMPKVSGLWAGDVHARSRRKGPLHKRLLGTSGPAGVARRRPGIVNALPQEQSRAQELCMREEVRQATRLPPPPAAARRPLRQLLRDVGAGAATLSQRMQLHCRLQPLCAVRAALTPAEVTVGAPARTASSGMVRVTLALSDGTASRRITSAASYGSLDHSSSGGPLVRVELHVHQSSGDSGGCTSALGQVSARRDADASNTSGAWVRRDDGRASASADDHRDVFQLPLPAAGRPGPPPRLASPAASGAAAPAQPPLAPGASTTSAAARHHGRSAKLEVMRSLRVHESSRVVLEGMLRAVEAGGGSQRGRSPRTDRSAGSSLRSAMFSLDSGNFAAAERGGSTSGCSQRTADPGSRYSSVHQLQRPGAHGAGDAFMVHSSPEELRALHQSPAPAQLGRLGDGHAAAAAGVAGGSMGDGGPFTPQLLPAADSTRGGRGRSTGREVITVSPAAASLAGRQRTLRLENCSTEVLVGTDSGGGRGGGGAKQTLTVAHMQCPARDVVELPPALQYYDPVGRMFAAHLRGQDGRALVQGAMRAAGWARRGAGGAASAAPGLSAALVRLGAPVVPGGALAIEKGHGSHLDQARSEAEAGMRRRSRGIQQKHGMVLAGICNATTFSPGDGVV